MKKLAITLLTIFSLFAISCEIGLGSSVDTEPPALDILTPKVDAIIRDNFVISGTWSDDGTIASISIKLERTDGNGTPKQYDGTFVENPQKRGSGTWTVEIPAVKDKIIDGTYQAVVTIKDTTSRTTTQSTTLSIDNTAPIIVLQRPGTKLNETPDAYGQTFTLNGMGADDNSIDHIDINIYSDKECTNLLKTITKSNVPPTIELDVAVFEDGKENDYSTIYGSTSKNGEQTRYCKITAYDNAKRYPLEGESTASDEVGNSTSDYYLYDDIYDSILDYYTITEVYKMLSGAYLLADSSRSADTVTEVKNLLEQFKITQGNFSLNPENSPQFIVNGRDPLTGSGTDFDGADYNITSDTSVVIEIATGLDGIPLDAPTLRPYVLLCDKFGAPVEEDKPENRIYLAAAGSGTKSGTSYKYTVNLNHTTPYEGGKYIILGNTYIFRVEGCDKNKNTIIPKGGTYGFKLSSNGAAPGLTVESPSESISRVGKNGKKTFSGIVTCQDGLPTIKIKNGEEIIWSKTFSSADIVPANGVQKFTFSYDIDYNGVTENSQIQYSIVASLGDLETTAFKTIIYDKDSPVIDVNSLLPMATKYYTSKNDSVYTDANPYDEQNPYTEDNYLNGTVTLKISVNDEYDSIETKEDEKKPYFEVIDGDSGEVISLKVGAETEAATKHLITTLINGSYKIDTTQIQTGSINKGIKFRIYAWDRAGNETIYTYPEATGTDSPVLKVNQDTDKPVILPASRDLSLTYTSKEARDAAPSRRSQIPSGGQLLLTLIDDDGIAGYKIFKVKYGDPAAQSTSSTEAFLTASDADNYFTSQDANVTEIDGNASTQLPVSEAGPSSAGYYWYKIVVRDINDVVSETEPFIIKTTSQAPKLMSVTAVESDPGDSAVGKYVGGSDSSKKKWENKIEIDSSEHPFYIYRREQAFGEEFDPDSTNPQVGQDSLVCITDASEYSDIIENPSENKKYYYKVYDNNWNGSNEKDITCYVDKTKPSNPTIDKPSEASYISGTTDVFTGEVRDSNAPSAAETKSGISKLYYKIKDSAEAPDSSEYSSQTLNDGRWNIDIKMGGSDFAEGKYWLNLYAEDAAGNKTDVIQRQFYIDQSAPSLEMSFAAEYYKHNETAEIVFTAEDTNKLSAINLLIKKNGTEIAAGEYSQNGISITDGSLATVGGKSQLKKTVTFTTDGTKDGVFVVSAEAVDIAGRKSTAVAFTTTIDGTKPVFSGDLTTGNGTNILSQTSYYKDTNLKVNGTCTETGSGMDALYYYVLPAGQSAPAALAPANFESTILSQLKDNQNNALATYVAFRQGSTDFSFNSDEYVNNSTSANTLYIQAVDKAGNVSEIKSFTVNIDTSEADLSTLYCQVGNGSVKKPDSTVYVNGSTKITVYGTYKDEQSGVNSLTFKLADANITPTEIKYSTTALSSVASISSASWKAYSSITDKKSIRSWKFTYTPTSGGKFAVAGSNTAGAASSESPFTISMDQTNPSLKNIRLLVDADNDEDAYKKTVITGTAPDTTSEEQYYINNSTNTALTISGTATDNVSVDSATLTIVEEGSNNASTKNHSYTNTGTSSDWKFENISMAGWSSISNGKDATAIITVTDTAGNTSSSSLNIYFDTGAPSGIHAIDSSEKDLYFRIGDADNDDITPSSTNPAWDNSKDTHVGGKYSAGTYGNSSTIMIRGNIGDSDSGVKMIYYAVFDKPVYIDGVSTSKTDTTDTEGKAVYGFKDNSVLRDYVIEHSTGYFAPLTTPQEKRVFYNISGSDPFGGTSLTATKYYKPVISNYHSTISGFDNPVNYLVIAAVDNVGNRGLDIIGDGNDAKNYCQINVDNDTPDITLNGTESSIRYSNGQADMSFSGRATDEGAGVKSVTFSVNGKEITSTNSANGQVSLDTTSTGNSKTNAAWTLSLKKEALAGASGNINVYATVIDAAGTGNKQTLSVATIVMDTTYPTATINSVTDADVGTTEIDVNKKFTLGGVSNDDMTISSVKLQYKKHSASEWKDYPVSPSGTYSWSVEIDTEATESGTTTKLFDDKNNYDFRAVAIDQAGNVGNSGAARNQNGTNGYLADNILTLYVNQDSDRPVIQFTNGQTLGTLQNPMTAANRTGISVSNLGGIVTDDDGVSKLEYKIDSVVDGNVTYGSWTTANLSSSAFTIPLTDGSKNIYFRVTDKAQESRIFEATQTESAAANLNTPKIKDGAETPVTYGYSDSAKKATALFVKVDTTAPFVGSLKFATDYVAATGNSNATGTWQDKSSISLSAFGGTIRNKLRIKIPVYDANGIASVKMEIPGLSDITFESTDESPNPVITLYPDAKYWLSEEIALSSLASGSKNCTIIVNDGVKISEETVTITVDNDAPQTINNVKPSKNETVSGVVNFRGNVSDNENGSGILYETDENGDVTNYGIKYFIPKYSERNSAPASISADRWVEPTIKGSVSWEIEFTNLGTTIGYNSENYAVGADYSGYETGSGTGLYDIPVWFRLTDAVGNVGYVTTNSIRYNPNADRPTVQITYPTHEEGKEYVTMGGTISISGMANDDDGIKAVYLQFDMDGNGSFENGVGITGTPFTASDIVNIPNMSGQKGILASGTKSWYKTLSISQLTGVNATANAGKTLNIRAIAIEKDEEKDDDKLLCSSWSDVLHISVNNTVPNFSGIKLKRYATAPTASNVDTKLADAEQEYQTDMFINGNETDWYLYGEVESSTEELDSISVTGSTSSLIKKAETGNKKYYFAVPLGEVSGKKWEIEITVLDKTEGTPQRSSQKIYIQVDKDAPTFADTKTVGGKTEIKLYKGSYGSAGDELSAENSIENRNGAFTLIGKISEEGSGYKRVVFYFRRNGSGTDTANRVYNPMESHGADNSENRTNIAAAKTSGSLYINGDELPALYISEGVTRSEENSITIASIKNNKNIRRGGLIKIGGVYRLITDVSARDSSGTISFTPNCSQEYTEAEFIYGMVIDHTGESQNADGTVKNDDDYADGMVESYTKSGTNYTWDATIDSKNIPDGPIEVHCVAFDNAGNISHGYTTTKVSNNPPRITSVMLGTDLNADNTYAIDKEFSTFYYSKTANGNGDTTLGTDVWNLDAKVDSETWWKAKKDLVVIPEFVGGTGAIYYNYSKSTGASPSGLTSAATGSTSASPATLAALSTSDNSIKASANGSVVTLSASQTGNKTGALILKNDSSADGLGKINTGTGEGAENIYRFSFWDSTEGCTIGSDSQWSVLNVKFYQDLVDNTDPTGAIKPFYWTSKTENSLEWNGTTALGHIELEEDLPATTFNVANTATSGLYDNDPKVSGKIKIEGSAFDETRLGSISVALGNKTATAAYSTSGWSGGNTDAGFSLTVSDSTGPTQSGHNVTWTLLVDTSTVVANNVTATDKALTITVNDAASTPNESASSTTQTTKATNTPYYKMDIVPYITEIVRGTDATRTYNTNRARSGAVSLRRGDIKNIINGFNLGTKTNTSIKIVPDKKAAQTGVSITTWDMVNKDANNNAVTPYLTFTVPDTAKSGYLHLVVNNVAALNNMNGYKDYNTETNAKAFDHNTLTDDRYVHIWRVSQQDTFKGSKNAAYPAMTSNNGTLYASFTNYGQSKTYYTSSFIGNGTVGVSSNQTGTTDGVTTVFNGYDPPEETDISVDSKGGINVFYAANYHGGYDYNWGNGNNGYPWNDTKPGNAGGIYVYDTSATSTDFGRTSHNAYRFELFTYDNELNQFRNIRVKRTNIDNTAYVNVVYYDKLTNAIKYSYATGGTNTSASGLPWVVIDGRSDVTDNSKLVPDHQTGNNNTFTFAGTWDTPRVLTDARYNGVTRSTGTGESVALTANNNGYPVILYMDAGTGQPRIAFAKSKTPNAVADWTVQGVFAQGDDNYDTASDYMSCIVDSSGYLHIAFQNTKGQLVYAVSTNNPSNGTTAYTFGASQVLDDSGMWIDMTMNGTTPYISYLSRVNSYDGMKIAFLDQNFDENNDGIADVGGGWETMTAALNEKVTNVRTCIEPNAKANDTTAYTAAVGFCPGLDYRAAFYVGQ